MGKMQTSAPRTKGDPVCCAARSLDSARGRRVVQKCEEMIQLLDRYGGAQAGLRKHSPLLSHLPAHLAAQGLGMSLSKPKGISCWERRRDPVTGYHRFAGMASNENPAGEEWGLCSPAGTSERAAVGWRSCCGGKPGLGEVSVPWCPCSGCVCSGCNVCVPQPGVGVTAQDLASQCLVLNLAALGCPERSLFPREEIPAGPCSSSPVKAAESSGC